MFLNWSKRRAMWEKLIDTIIKHMYATVCTVAVFAVLCYVLNGLGLTGNPIIYLFLVLICLIFSYIRFYKHFDDYEEGDKKTK